MYGIDNLEFSRLWSTSGPVATLFMVAAWFLVLRLGILAHRVMGRRPGVDLMLWVHLYTGISLVAQKARFNLADSQDFGLLLLFPTVSILMWTLGQLLLTLLWPIRWLAAPIPPETADQLQCELVVSFAAALVFACLTAYVLRRREAQSSARKVRLDQS